MSAVAESAHWDECWRVHDNCALSRAAAALHAQPITRAAQDTLELIRAVIADHAAEPCPNPTECYAVGHAREVLDSSTSGATEFATGDHDRGVAP